MSEVKVGENESIESALKRFKKKVQKAGILSEIKRRERYEKPSVKKKRKQEAARKRSRKFCYWYFAFYNCKRCASFYP